jgi:hypothetical protein
MDMAFLISTGEKTGRDKIINEILQWVRVQNSLTELEEEQLQSFGHVKGMDRTRILRGQLELKFQHI